MTDLTALSGLRLNALFLDDTRTFDISALRGMKLKKISLSRTRVSDLSPLSGMPLTFFEATTIPATDYSPLAGAPMEKLTIQNSPARDLSFLRDSPVKELCLYGCNELRGYSVLAGLKALDLLILPQSYRSLPEEELAVIGGLRTHPNLKNIQTEYRSGGGWIIPTTHSKDIFWQDWDREQTFVPALRKSGFKFSISKLPTGTYSLAIQNQPLRDLSILKGAPISEFTLYSCPVSDLAPIQDLKLEALHLSCDSVADLSPLRGMPLKTLYVQGSKISDLSPLKGLPLRELYLEGCPSVADVSALAEIPTLEKLTVPMSARNIEALRQLTQLKMLAFSRNANTLLPSSTVEDFWKDNDANGWLGRLRESGLKANTLNQLDDGTWEVNLDNSAIADLTLLRGAPISRLSISHTPVSDLTPLRNLALKQLWLFETKVTDLSPLTGMPIEVLNLGGTKVSDIAALRGMPLVELSLLTCSEVIDLSPLANVTTLRTLTLSAKAKNFEFLRSMKGLERLSYDQDRQSGYRPNKTAREFWNDYDQKTQAAGKQP